jgi:hypothetical protein
MLYLTTNSSDGLSAMVCNYTLLKLACNSRPFTKNGGIVAGCGGGGLSASSTFCDRMNLNSLKCEANFVFGFNFLRSLIFKIIDIDMGHSKLRNSMIGEFVSYWWSLDSRFYVHLFVFGLNSSSDLIFEIIDIDVGRSEVRNSVIFWFVSYWLSLDSRFYVHLFVFGLNSSSDLIFKIIDIDVGRSEVRNSVIFWFSSYWWSRGSRLYVHLLTHHLSKALHFHHQNWMPKCFVGCSNNQGARKKTATNVIA